MSQSVAVVKRKRGRPFGAASKTNEEVRRRAAETGELPLEYMLRVMRDHRTKIARRDMMAVAAAPYIHSRLTATTVDNKHSGTVRIIDESMSGQEAASAYADMLKANPLPMIDVTPNQQPKISGSLPRYKPAVKAE